MQPYTFAENAWAGTEFLASRYETGGRRKNVRRRPFGGCRPVLPRRVLTQTFGHQLAPPPGASRRVATLCRISAFDAVSGGHRLRRRGKTKRTVDRQRDRGAVFCCFLTASRPVPNAEPCPEGNGSRPSHIVRRRSECVRVHYRCMVTVAESRTGTDLVFWTTGKINESMTHAG